MTSVERDETTTTITGLAPGMIRALRRAAGIAAEHGHNWIGEEDLLLAVLGGATGVGEVMIGRSALETRWRIQEAGAMTYDELLSFVESIVPGPGRGVAGPATPATVDYSVAGPNADELTNIIER